MSSWSRAPNKPPPRIGYYQKLPEGTFRQTTEPSTVVSAYYDVKKSKHTPEAYRKWIRLFLESSPCYLIFFTESELVPFIEDCRKGKEDRTRIVTLKREEWTANTAFEPGFWESQHHMDVEKQIHSPDLYKVWYEKKEFVKRAIALNPFGHSTYVWADAGLIRNPELCDLVAKRFPVTQRIPIDRILLLNWWPYSQKDDTYENFANGVRIKSCYAKPRILAGVLAGSISAWSRWDTLYDDCLKRFISAGVFAGKEQNLMGVIAIENKEAVSLLDLHKIAPDPWFYLVLYLGVEDSLYALFRSDSKKKESYRELLDRCQPKPFYKE